MSTFTREDVAFLRKEASRRARWQRRGGRNDPATDAELKRQAEICTSLADRIEALLPPDDRHDSSASGQPEPTIGEGG